MRRATFGSISSCCTRAEAGRSPQCLELAVAQAPPSARQEPLKREWSDPRPHEANHSPARTVHHATNLTISSFDQLDLVLRARPPRGERPHTDCAQPLALRLDPRDEPREPRTRQWAIGPHPVHFGYMVPRVNEPRRQLAVVGEQQESLAVPVEPSHRIQADAQRARQKIEHRPAPLRVSARAQHTTGLVQEEVVPRLRTQPAPVHADVVPRRIHPGARLQNRPAVDHHSTGANPLDGAASRRDATLR